MPVEGELIEEAVKSITSEISPGVNGEPEGVAYAALYLASDESRYVTGIELDTDGQYKVIV